MLPTLLPLLDLVGSIFLINIKETCAIKFKSHTKYLNFISHNGNDDIHDEFLILISHWNPLSKMIEWKNMQMYLI